MRRELAGREKGGFWIGVLAVIFYPMTWIAKQRYRSAERIPSTGGVLLVMNHVSHYDPCTDSVFVHRRKRIPHILAKEAVLTIPVLGRILRGTGGVIPVYRGTTSVSDALKAAHQALRDGKLVLIYPEGTITKRADGWPKNSFTGVARLALSNDVPVIPAARWGTNFVLDGYRKKFRPLPRKTVVYKVGEPMDLSAYRGMPQSAAVLREVTDLIMDEVTELLAEIRDERPPAKSRTPEEAPVDGD